MLGDLGAVEEFSDERLATAITIAAILVQQEYTFNTTYTVDVEAPCLEPDPTDSATLDQAAIALFTLKAACLVLGGSYHDAIRNGVRIDDWQTSIDTRPRLDGYKDIIATGPCKSYQLMLETMTWNKLAGKGKAVFGPYSTQTQGYIVNGHWDVVNFFNTIFY